MSAIAFGRAWRNGVGERLGNAQCLFAGFNTGGCRGRRRMSWGDAFSDQISHGAYQTPLRIQRGRGGVSTGMGCHRLSSPAVSGLMVECEPTTVATQARVCRLIVIAHDDLQS